MFKLYYTPGACSLAPHIVFREAGIPFELVRVDLAQHMTEGGTDYFAVNSRGQVPVLELEDGERLTEGAVIAQYAADQAGSTTLLPRGGMPRYRVIEWQSYVGTELHKSFGPLFVPAFPSEGKAFLRERLREKYEWLEERLPRTGYLLDGSFTIADAYLFTITRWSQVVDLDLSDLSRVGSYLDRVAARPAVQASLKAEGLSV